MSRRRTDRWFSRLWVVVIVMAMVAAACGDDDSGDAGAPDTGDDTTTTTEAVDDGEPQPGGSITVGLEAETNSWMPGQGNFSNPGINVALAIYDPLLRRDDSGEPTPYLTESIEANDELDEWTLTLREGVQFHDGTPLNAEALKTIFDTYIAVEGSNLAGQVAEVESLDVVDELTVVYRLAQPNDAFDDVLTGAVGWPFSPTAAAAAGDRFPAGRHRTLRLRVVAARQPPHRREERQLLAGGPSLPGPDRVPADPRRGHPHLEPLHG